MQSSESPRILVIDNDEGVVQALITRLEHLGYRCATASTGAQGIAAFQNGDIDLIISDLNMPAGDGITLATTIRTTSSVPIIILTGFHHEYRRDLRSLSNVTVLQKPFDANDLIDLVEAELVMHGQRLPCE